MHFQLPCIANQVLYSYLRTLKYRTFAYAPILHKYKTYVTDPRPFMPASPWHSCRDAALFPNYFGQTCFIHRCLLHDAAISTDRSSSDTTWDQCTLVASSAIGTFMTVWLLKLDLLSSVVVAQALQKDILSSEI